MRLFIVWLSLVSAVALAEAPPVSGPPASVEKQAADRCENAPPPDVLAQMRKRRRQDSVREAKTVRRIHHADPQIYVSASVTH